MKQFSAFIMAVFMLGLSVQNAMLIVSFKLNQQYISSNLCENRNTTAEKVCNGTCYLEDQLAENNNTGENDQLPALNEIKETVLYFNALTALVTGSEKSRKITAAISGVPISSGYLSGIFHPPQV